MEVPMSPKKSYEVLYDRHKDKQKKLKDARQSKLVEETKDCTFQPNMEKKLPPK